MPSKLSLLFVGCLLALRSQARELDGRMASVSRDGHRYIGKIASHFDLLLRGGVDRFGRVHTNLWMSVLSTETGLPPGKPHVPKRVYRLIGAPNGCAAYWDQAMLAAACNLSRVTGKPDYANAAQAYVNSFLDRCVSNNGVFQWGNHVYYDAHTDEIIEFSGGHHELRPFAPAWELFWREDPDSVIRYIDVVSQRHLYDAAKGGFNRHDDGTRGHAFIESGGVLAESLAWAYAKTHNRALLERAVKIAEYSYSRRNPRTGLLPNEPDYGRWDSKVSTTEVGLWAGCLLKAADYAGRDDLVRMAADGVRAFLTYGYDERSRRYYGQLNVADGRPVIPKEKGYWPRKHSLIWNPDQWPTHDYPHAMADACIALFQRTGEEVFVEGVRRWVDIVLSSPAPHENEAVYAETYGRSILFLLRSAQALDRPELCEKAEAIADEAVDRLYETGGMFESEAGSRFCCSVDGLGYLFLALIKLDANSEPESYGLTF